MSLIQSLKDRLEAVLGEAWSQLLRAHMWTASAFSSPRRAREILSTLLPSRTTLFGFWGTVSTVSVALILLVFNPTPSLPQGFYVRGPLGEIHRGDLVSFCLSPAPARFALDRKYLPSSGGSSHPQCPGGAPPMIKKVQALPGDTVEVRLDGVFINGTQFADPPPHCDASVRPLPIQYGTHRLQSGEYWVTTDLYLSLDSRIYGPIHRSQMFAEAYPVLTGSGSPKHIKSNPVALRRTDCSTQVKAGEPLLDQVDLLSQTAELDSLKSAAFNQQFDSGHAFRPPLSFDDLVVPPEYPLEIRNTDETTTFARQSADH